jgi:hypothetical protein
MKITLCTLYLIDLDFKMPYYKDQRKRPLNNNKSFRGLYSTMIYKRGVKLLAIKINTLLIKKPKREKSQHKLI